VTAHGNERFAAEALRRGADDYLAKDDSLPELLPYVLERVRRNRELQKALEVADRDRVRVERLAAMGELTVTLRHGINNPLMAASAATELLLAEPAMPEDQRRKLLDELQGSLRRIRDIVRQAGDLRAARTTSYLPGLRMVELNAAEPAPAPPPRGLALVYGPEDDLVRIVSLLLRDAGFSVERSATIDELMVGASRVGTALVLVQAGSGAAGAHPLAGFDPPAARDYRVVALVAGDGEAALAAGADLAVELPFDPGSFTAEMVGLAG
jgi:signal transduction histidine kinase